MLSLFFTIDIRRNKTNQMLIYIFFFIICELMLLTITFVHEIGHAIFILLFKGKIKTISIGKGATIFTIGKIEIKKKFWYGGLCLSEDSFSKLSIVSRILIILGGILMNIFFAIIFYYLHLITKGQISIYYMTYSVLNFMYAVKNLIPVTKNGINYDGKQLYLILKYGKSSVFSKE